VYPNLPDDARDVLRTLIFREQQIAPRDGRWFTVRVLPYRTLENKIAVRLHPFATGVSVFCRLTDGSDRAPHAHEPA
jgi:hypothetical protein